MLRVRNIALQKQYTSWLIFRLEVEQFGECANNARHLFHASGKLIVSTRLKVIGDHSVDECQHVAQFHRGSVLAKHPHQRLDEPGTILVVTPREVT